MADLKARSFGVDSFALSQNYRAMLNAIRDTTHLYKPFVLRSLGLLIGLFMLTELFQNYFLYIISATREAQSANVPAMLGQVLTSMLEFVVLTMLVPLRVIEHQERRTHPMSYMAFTQKHIGALTAESLRSLAVTIMWFIAFILPGIFKYIRLSFVPYVVVADPEYEAGKRDALERSNELVKGITLQLFLLLVVMFMVEYARSWVRENFLITQSPLITVGAGIVFFSMNIYANILLFRIYQLKVVAASQNAKEISHAT